MPREWRKVLYEDQGVPDNYVDKSFLAQMRKNIYVREYKYWDVVIKAGSVQQQFCWNVLFAVCFTHLYWGNLLPWHVFYFLLPSAVIGYCIYRFLAQSQSSIVDDLRTAVLFVGILLALSPVLRTLTETISSDTIFAMSVLFFLADLAFHNYESDTEVMSTALSLNAALFAAICLTSRLATNFHTFVTISMAMIVFGLRPPLTKRLRMLMYPYAQIVLTATLCVGAFVASVTISDVAGLGFLLLSFTIMFLCPFLLVSMQSMKNNIYGPWDEALVKE